MDPITVEFRDMQFGLSSVELSIQGHVIKSSSPELG